MDFTQPKMRFVFEKGGYAKLRQLLVQSNWKNKFDVLVNEPNSKPEELWQSLKLKLHQLAIECVPLITPSNKPTWQDKENIPLDRITRNSIKEKEKAHRLWIKSLNSEGEKVARLNYTRARNQVKTQLRKAKRQYERKIALEAKKNPRLSGDTQDDT